MRHLLFLLIAVPAFAQGLLSDRVQVGAVGGVGITDVHRLPSRIDESKRYIVGPSVEIRLNGGFVLEIDALYRRLGQGRSFLVDSVPQPYFYASRIRTNSWEFPILAKYRFHHRGRFEPFVGGGSAFRVSWNHEQTITNNTSTTPAPIGDYRSPMSVGAVALAGVSFKAGPLKVSPQFRYTRWGGFNFERTQNNQLDFLVGIHF